MSGRLGEKVAHNVSQADLSPDACVGYKYGSAPNVLCRLVQVPNLEISIEADKTDPLPWKDTFNLSVVVRNPDTVAEAVLENVVLNWNYTSQGRNLRKITVVPYTNDQQDNSVAWKVFSGNNGRIPPGATKKYSVAFRTNFSGTVRFDASATVGGISFTSDSLDYKIPVTKIPFDERHKAIMFWIIYNKTSEDTFENFTLPPSVASGINTDFLRVPPYCDTSFPDYKDQNRAPGEQVGSGGWDSSIAYIYHCNVDASLGTPPETSFAYVMAHTFINGMISSERLSGTEGALGYGRANYKGSINKGNYTLWQAPACGIGEYQVALKTGNDVAARWLWDHLMCKINNPTQAEISNGRAAIFQNAYNRIMPYIEKAIERFRGDCSDIVYEECSPNRTDDPSNRAFSVLGANVLGVSLYACAGGCAGQNFIKPIGSVTNTDIQDAYNTFMSDSQRLKRYKADFPTVLRPVLRTVRVAVFSGGNITGYNYGGYRWYAFSFRQTNETNQVPITR